MAVRKELPSGDSVHDKNPKQANPYREIGGPQAQGRQDWERCKWVWSFFQSIKNALELDSNEVAQFYEYTKTDLYSKIVDFMEMIVSEF